MLYYAGVFLTFVYIGATALLVGFCYSVSLPLCRRLNKWITDCFSVRLVRIFKTYFHFKFLADPSEKNNIPESCLIISNHQSLMDIPMLMVHLHGSRLRFVAKAELAAHIPIVAPMLKSDGHCLVVRGGQASKVMDSIDGFARQVAEHNWLPVIFPEGTRSKDGSLGRFHAAGFRRFLDDAPMPVAAFAIDGGWQYSDLKGIVCNLKNGFYRIKLLKVFPPPHGKEEQLAILEESRGLIQKQLDEWRVGRPAALPSK